ncbi:MAG TPA: hypothetical protein VF534_00490 [Paraburkholderia sp.]
MNRKEKMLAGEMYAASAPEIQADRNVQPGRGWCASKRRTYRSNSGIDSPQEHLAAIGPDSMIRPRFHCVYGFNISLASVFLNFNCIILDVISVEFGDVTQIVTGVQVLTADLSHDGQFSN